MKMYEISTCDECKYSEPEKPNATVQKLIDEGKVMGLGMLKCTSRVLAVNNKQVHPEFGCIYWEAKDAN